MQAYKTEAVVPQNGTIEIDLQEFRPGEMVQIIVLGSENGVQTNGTNANAQAVHIDLDEDAKQLDAITAIQDGEFAHLRMADGMLASDAFAARKQVEKRLEERRWSS